MDDAPNTSTSYFERTGTHTFMPTHWTSGAWNSDEQHFSPIGGLIVHAVEQFLAERGASDNLVIAKVQYDILGVVELVPMEVAVRSVRPGRTIELLEAEVHAAGRTVALARMWRLAQFDTRSAAGGEPPTLPHPATLTRWPMDDVWPGDYIASLDVRAVTDPSPGRGAAWISTDINLVADEPVSNLARFIMLVDTANGVAVRESPRDWAYPNLDLSIHLYRQPRGPWVGFETQVVFGSAGQGLTSTVLHDEHGPVGRAEQTLTVRQLQ